MIANYLALEELKWFIIISHFQTVLCQSLATPSNGQLSLGTDGSVTLATVTCDSNYYLQGDPVLTCATNGLWSGAMPSCGRFESCRF